MARRPNRPALQELEAIYRRQPIVLYTGAGVSKGNPASDVAFFDWWDLLAEILKRRDPPATDATLATLRRHRNPWEGADYVVRRCGGRARCQDILREIVRDRKRFPKPKQAPRKKGPSPYAKKQLGGTFLSQNPTLESVVAFCGSLTAATAGRPNAEKHSFRAAPNRRVRAVLTGNYDPFLEAASSSKFKKALLKPVAAYGSDAGDLKEIPVFHVHGYVPHPDQPEGVSYEPLVKQLVLDSASYDRAWESTDVFGPTMQPQIHYLRNYVALFVGYSFSDERVRGLLREIRAEFERGKRARAHYALVSADELERRGEGFYDRLGIRPIRCADHGEVPRRLEHIYRAGLDADHGGPFVSLPRVAPNTSRVVAGPGRRLSKQDYWRVLRHCRNTAVARRQLEGRASR